MNNPYFLSALAGLCVFIFQVILKKSKNLVVDRAEILKLAAASTAITFGILHFYERPLEPVLNEPFTSSFES